MTEHQTILPVGEEALRAAARTIGGSAAWAVAEIERLRAAGDNLADAARPCTLDRQLQPASNARVLRNAIRIWEDNRGKRK